MRYVWLMVCVALTALVAFGQTDRGTITGTISDPAGAVVANAAIEARNTETGTIYPAVSTATGNYTITQLPVGIYEVTVSVTGFKKYVRQNVPVQAAQTLGIDVPLEVGSNAEAVTVTAEVSLLKTESSDVSTNVAGDRLVTLGILPIGNGFSSSHGVRNPMTVATLAPGTFFDPNLNIKVNGAPSNTESVRVDGQDVTNGVVTFSQAQTQPSVDAIQELAVQTSNYAAEYGQAGAGVFNYTMKSGTNQFHGTLYDYNANEAYNAAQAYTHSRPQLRRNDLGGTLGGPVWIPKIYNGHDRTFFFWNYEEFIEKGVITNQYPTVPTDAYRNGNFATAMGHGTITGSPADSTGRIALDGQIFNPASEIRDAQGRRVWTPFDNNIIPPTSIDPAARKLLALIPSATNKSLLTQNYNNPYPTDRRTPIPALKVDHSFTEKAKISGYWSTTETAVQYCTPLCGSDGLPDPITVTRGTFIESHTERLNFDYTLKPTMLLHLGVGYAHNDFKDKAPTTNFDVAGILGITGSALGPNDGARFPVFYGDLVAGVRQNITGSNSQGGMNNMGPVAGQVRAVELKPTVNASLTWVRDNHTFKFGLDGRTDGYVDYTYTNTSGSFDFSADQTANPYYADAGVAINGGTTGFPFASLLLGRVKQVQIAPFTQMRGGRFYSAFFAQDTWKVTRKLTLDYGLRWDYSTYSREQYGRAPGFSASVANPTAGGHLGASIFEGEGPGRCGCDLAHNYPYAFGPRLGVAYQIDPKTVLRAGFGITYAAYTGGRYVNAPGALQTIDTPSFGNVATTLGNGITNQGTPIDLSWPKFLPGIYPAPRTTSGAPAVFDQNSGRPARQTQWSIGIQRELSRDLAIDVAYVGNRGAWWRSSALTDYNALTSDLLHAYGLDINNSADRALLGAQIGSTAAGRFQNKLPYAGFPATASVAQSLRPFPQFTALTGAGPLGDTWYDSLQAKVTKRLSHGLDASYVFTWSKELQLGADTDGGGLSGQVNDIFNRATNKQYSSFSRPLVSNISVSYQLPKWGPNRYVRYAVADWTIASSLTYASGFPIPVPGTALSTSNLGTSLLRTTHAERVPGVNPFLVDLNCHCFDPAQTQILNPAAWKDPAPGTFSPSAYYYDDYRYERRPKESLSVGRIFRIRERASLTIRAEFINPFNRTQIPNPIATGYTTAIAKAGAVNNTGFGAIATKPLNAVIGERSGLIVARFAF